MTENGKSHTGDDFLNSGLQTDIQRGWIVPVGGSTPDRLREGGFFCAKLTVTRDFGAIIPPIVKHHRGARLSGGPLNTRPE